MSHDTHASAVQMIDAAQVIEDCGLGHACSFCPKEQDCQLDQGHHDKTLVENRLGAIDWIIPVLANKGGIGKSTVSANLAVAMARQGFRVGLADADIHGPNAPRFFGLQDERVKVSSSGVNTPEFSCGDYCPSLKIGSLGFLLGENDTPVVWRDAYKHDYIHHMIGSFNWGPLDFLIVDMPPGTGNELITLTDMLEGYNVKSILVSSADAIVLQDTLKASRFCRERGLPILGLVENYAGTVCPHCGGEFEMFPRAEEIEKFESTGIETLARIPFSPIVGQAAARGRPWITENDHSMAPVFNDLIERLQSLKVESSGVFIQGEINHALSEVQGMDALDSTRQELQKMLTDEQQRLTHKPVES